ncbi:MAG: ATP-binding protein, partial [Sulfurimonas sp.]|nr:ATP-binding protein [Sulfurimonas sp.]
MNIAYFFHKSLRRKLFLVLIIIGFLPFLTLLIYTLFLSETKILNKIVIEQLERTNSVARLINNHLSALSKEVNFLSSLDLMDDILVEDIDKRVSRLLTQKADDFNLDVTLFCINLEGLIIASSNKEILYKKFDTAAFTHERASYIKEKELYVYSKIHTSFDNDKTTGYLVLRYNLNNLDLYLTHQNTIHSYIINSTNAVAIGENLALKLDFATDTNSVINAAHVIVYKRLSSVMQDWYIVYAVDKNIALAFLDDFIRFMLTISIFIFAFILYFSLRYSKDIVKPIEELTKLTNEITKTQDYSAKVEINSTDEIATLSDSFNKMIQTTSLALAKLEEENSLRLKRFTQLIEVFNTIIQTKSEDECINISIKEIAKLTGKKDLYFIEKKDETAHTEFAELYVNDFEKDTKIFFGSIALDIKQFEDKNERDFYNSIASMITLQLDKIRLIKRTLGASNAKSAFISNISHELRTPLNAIIGATQYMISYETLSDEQIDTLSTIELSAQYLLEMINEVLDIAKIEAGKMEVNLQNVNIISLLQNCYDMLYPLASDKELEFTFNFDTFEPTDYETDPKILQQIVLNLLSNAIKFTEKGKITLELTNDEHYLYIKVQDEGIGIAHEDMDLLFHDFIQLKNTIHKTQEGTGLGLSLSRKMAKILHGDIEVFSEGVGFGTSV